MLAREVMTTAVVTVPPSMPVEEVARLLLERRISGVPVVEGGRMLGIVTEDDLMRQPEAGGAHHPSWWLRFIQSPEDRLKDYLKAHARRVGDIMTRKVVSVTEEATLEDIAACFEKHGIKRVPVLRDGRLVGIVSRADLLRGLLVRRAAGVARADDYATRNAVIAALEAAGLSTALISVIVTGGVVHLWGVAETAERRHSSGAVAESVAGVAQVENHMTVMPAGVRAAIWAE